MRRLLKYTAILLMVLMTGSSVWAYSFSDHVTTAPNNKGDVLIYPWFLATSGWETKLTVINTDTSAAVVAKVVIRSFKNSEELIDFLIYLSPADVWTGKLTSVSGKVYIDSDDDSAVYSESPLVFASTTPIHQPMFALDCADDAEFLGYVEVIMAAYKTTDSAGGALSPGLSKTKIFNGYWNKAVAAADTIGPMLLPSSTAGVNPNSLAGYMQLQNGTLGYSTSLRATTLKDYDTSTKLTTSVETKLGGVNSLNTLDEVEAALSKNNIAMPYVNGNNTALHFFTFPTKLTARGTLPACENKTVDSSYFKQNSYEKTVTKTNQWCIEYILAPFDLKENTPAAGPFSGGGSHKLFCDEVNFVASSAIPYTEGWGKYVLSSGITSGSAFDGSAIAYAGAPVIPTYLYLGELGIEANYGAWTDTAVAGSKSPNTYILIDYQYTDSAVMSVTVQ